MLSVNISDIPIMTGKGVDYRSVICDINKSDTTHLLENYVFDDCEFL